MRDSVRDSVRGSPAVLAALVIAVALQAVAPASAKETKDIRDVRCPSTTTTTMLSTTTTTLDPLCVILGTDAKKKRNQIDAADEVFLGDVQSDGNAGGCLASWEGTILLIVNDGKITKPSLGVVETTGQPGCTVIGGSGGTAYSELFQIRGRVSGERVRLKFLDPTDECYTLASNPSVPIFCWGVPGGSVTRKDSQITGRFATDLGVTTFKTTVDLGKSF